MNLKQKILDLVKPSEKDENEIRKDVTELVERLNSAFKKSRINAKAIIGGSFAKSTTIKKDRYDVDIFAVFEGKYKSEEISEILEKILKKEKIMADKLPGSRDYFSVNFRHFKAEIVPVIKVSKPKEAKNITDLSLLHVKYITNAIRKNKKLSDEIRLVKALCYANNCYGAESHIRGFSGYCLEILTAYYNGFDKLIKEAAKWNDKVIIDPAKYYKGKNVLAELNEAKLLSPLILIDPVQSDRNAAAALSEEKFKVFRNICREFAKRPSEKFFERKIIDEDSIIKNSKKEKSELYKVIARSEKTKEDTSGSKLLKLFNLIKLKLEKENYQFKSAWDFKNKGARMWFSVKQNIKTMRPGPFLSMKSHVQAFRKKYKKTFVKNKRIFAYSKPKELKEIFSVDAKQLAEMGITDYKVVKIN